MSLATQVDRQRLPIYFNSGRRNLREAGGMYPFAMEFLTLLEIARHWARDLPQRPPWEEILHTLLDAMWNGELRATLGPGDRSTHERLLRMLAHESHPGILIYDDPINLPPVTRPTPDRGEVVDMRERIYLPRDTAAWTPEVISDACGALARCELNDYGDSIRSIFASLEVTKEDFGMFCEARGYERGAFWFGRDGATGPRSASFPGRPSIMRAIETEMRRRANAGHLAPQLRDEAQALQDWAKHTHADQQVPGVRAIENALRSVYRKFRGARRSPIKT